MEISIREAKAQFAEAANAAARGERVIVTKHGIPFVELVPAAVRPPLDMARLEAVRAEIGIGPGDSQWFNDFISNPEASRRALGIDD